MSVEWKKTYWQGDVAITERGVFAVRPIATLKDQPRPGMSEDLPSWEWEWQPPKVNGTACNQAAAMTAALYAPFAERRVEWVLEFNRGGAEWHCAVAFGCWMRVKTVRVGRLTAVEVPNEHNDGWDWEAHYEGGKIGQGWCKTIDEAKTAAETAASAVEASK
jgi:hypothetical protein